MPHRSGPRGRPPRRRRHPPRPRPVRAHPAAARPPSPKSPSHQPRSTRWSRRTSSASCSIATTTSSRSTSRTACRCRAAPASPTISTRLLDALRFGAPDRPRLVHRLDRDTSGVLLLARTPGTAAKLAALFRGRDIEKTYWAVTARRPHPARGPHRLSPGPHRRRPRRAHRRRRARRPRRRPRHSPTTARSTTPARNLPGWSCGRAPAAPTNCACIASPSARRSWAT